MAKFFGIMIAALVYMIACLFSWGFTCLIIMAICHLFAVGFSLKIATGVWLVMFLIKMTFGRASRSE